jgi:GTP-binding protein
MFIDKARIFITAGRGGAGCISFRREKFVPLGGPDGGNGGKGGDVYLLADPHLTTLLDLAYRPHYRAVDGQAGQNSNKFGRGGADLTIKVPLGTVVRRNGEVLADLKDPGRTIMVAAGGRGGRGNASFKTGRHTAPHLAEKGEPGEEVALDLELKLIADVGLVGFPNAGKSTFLARVSAARPKIADYPFTTLTPNLGVVSHKEKQFVVADIPGLIEGAHTGKGIGDEFLRHIQRTRIIIHLVDMGGFDGKDPVENFRTINKELASYSKALLDKPMLVAANKMDLTDAPAELAKFKRRVKGTKVFPISAATGAGIDALLAAVVHLLNTLPPPEEVVPEPVRRYVYAPEFTVTREGDIFVVAGPKVEKLAAMTDFNQEEALRRFQNILKKMGVEQMLEDQGVKPGDTVRVGTREFVYEK